MSWSVLSITKNVVKYALVLRKVSVFNGGNGRNASSQSGAISIYIEINGFEGKLFANRLISCLCVVICARRDIRAVVVTRVKS